MRRYVTAVALAIACTVMMIACGKPPAGPTPGTGGNGGNGGGGGPVVNNTPPTIKSLTAGDTRVEVGTPVTLTASVEDADTPVANLTYDWVVPNGTITGTGVSVSWTPGAEAVTPADFVVTLNVTEKYTSGSVQVENKATSTVTVHVNNSNKELAEQALRFLGNFVNSKVSPEACVAEFTSNCSGKKEEFDDIDDNRHDYEIVASTLRHTSLSVAGNRTSATVNTFCSFTSKVISSNPRDEVCANGGCPLGSTTTATGTCVTTHRYEQGKWWLCTSSFDPNRTLVPQGVIPSFFSHPGRGR